MVSCPKYYGNSLEMLIEYLGEVAEFASADLCLYDNPIASHTLLSVADIARIAESVPRVTHIKVTDTAIDKVAELRAATALVILAGDDAVMLIRRARLRRRDQDGAGARWRNRLGGAAPAAHRAVRGAPGRGALGARVRVIGVAGLASATGRLHDRPPGPTSAHMRLAMRSASSSDA
jgi:hypothetical protein